MAQLAGVPSGVIAQAKTLLLQLEQSGHTPTPVAAPLVTADIRSKPAPVAPQQPDMFATASSGVEDALRDIDADDLTPRQALELIYSLKKMM